MNRKVTFNHKILILDLQQTEDCEPKETIRCFICGHRNIKPQIFEMHKCYRCNKTICCKCIVGINKCMECY
jgi:hypothetical protein